ncbi:hypothetical protein [Micromonospora sp. NPDC005710]
MRVWITEASADGAVCPPTPDSPPGRQLDPRHPRQVAVGQRLRAEH